MRIGVLTLAEIEQLDWAQQLGFRSMEWVQFDSSPAGPNQADWKPFAEMIAAEAKARDIRISAIAALYRNPLDPRQSEEARAAFNGRSMSLHTLVSKRWLDFQAPSSKPSSMNAVGISFTNRSRIICRS